MPIGKGYNVALRYVKESTFGTTPSSALKNLRYTSESLETVRETRPNSDIRTGRRFYEILELTKESQGDVQFELSYSNMDELLEGALSSSWSNDDPSTGTDTLEDGSTDVSFTFEKEYSDLTTPEFYTFTGCKLNTLGLQLSPGNPITASVSMMGKAGSVSTSTAGTGAATAAPTNNVMVVGAHVSSFKEGGTASGDEIGNVLDFSLNVNNNLRVTRQVKSIDVNSIELGMFELTGTIRAYLEDSSLIDKFENQTASNLQVIVADDASNQYQFDIHNLYYINGRIEQQGQDGDAIVALDWQAIRDSSEQTVIRIRRS